MEELFNVITCLTVFLLVYTWPLILGLFCIWIFRKIVDRDSYSRDFISGLIMLCASREFLRNFRPHKK